jgi:hypothetical protein
MLCAPQGVQRDHASDIASKPPATTRRASRRQPDVFAAFTSGLRLDARHSLSSHLALASIQYRESAGGYVPFTTPGPGLRACCSLSRRCQLPPGETRAGRGRYDRPEGQRCRRAGKDGMMPDLNPLPSGAKARLGHLERWITPLAFSGDGSRLATGHSNTSSRGVKPTFLAQHGHEVID